MRIELRDEALEFGRQATRAFEAAGGDGLLLAAEQDPAGRAAVVEPALGGLGAMDLSPRGSADELEAAAALCRAAGWWAVPYPVAEVLARPADAGVRGLVAVAGSAPVGAVAGLEGSWATISLDGARGRATAGTVVRWPKTTALVVDLALGPPAPSDAEVATDLALALVLPCWTLLGMLDRAIDVTCRYVSDRHQFGQPLAGFQSVQFQLTEAEVERAGVEELAKYALWSIETGSPDAVDDALALRWAAVDAAHVVFRITHQLHGAIGFCDETVLSWLSRASQPLRRLPVDAAGTRAALLDAAGRRGLRGLFGEGRPERAPVPR